MLRAVAKVGLPHGRIAAFRTVPSMLRSVRHNGTPLVYAHARRTLCSSPSENGTMSPGKAAHEGTALPLRFPLGTPVRCFVGGERDWVRGTVIAHNHREPSWPEHETVPYQILLNDNEISGAQNAIWAPADNDDIIRTDFRFSLGEQAECRIGEHEWAQCTGVKISPLLQPYRVPGCPCSHHDDIGRAQ